MLTLDKRQAEEVWLHVSNLALWCQIYGGANANKDNVIMTQARDVIYEERAALEALGIKAPK